MAGFVKIYGSILDSSIWAEALATRVVWITMLAMADRDGLVSASSDGISRRANVSLKQTDAALEQLRSPDPRSKNQENDGRRVERCDSGWRILNYNRYRELRTDKQIADAERIRHLREQGKYDNRGPVDANATRSNVALEAEADTETTTTPVVSVPARERPRRRSGLPPYDQVFEEAWGTYPRRPGNSKVKAWRQWLARVGEGTDPMDLLDGIRRYAKHVEAAQTPPQFVKHASTFLGEDKHFESDWTPAPPADPITARIAQLQAEEDAALARTREMIAAKRSA